MIKKHAPLNFVFLDLTLKNYMEIIFAIKA